MQGTDSNDYIVIKSKALASAASKATTTSIGLNYVEHSYIQLLALINFKFLVIMDMHLTKLQKLHKL